MSGLDVLDGERGIPAVSDASSKSQRRAIGSLAIVGVLIGLLVWMLWHSVWTKDGAETTEQEEYKVSSALPARTFTDFEESESEPEPEPETAAAEPENTQPPIVVVPAAARRESESTAPNPVLLDKTSGTMLASNSIAAETATTAPSQTVVDAGAEQLGESLFGGDEASSELSDLLSPTTLNPTSARRIDNQSMTLAKGGFIDCVLKTKLESTVPGLSSCSVTSDVYSIDGKVLLIERGSTITGEYRSNLRQGQSRIFVLWNRVRTPSGVLIDIESPATDALGATGLDGDIDTHFWKRFGGAFLLSLVDDVARGVTQNSSDITLNAGTNAGATLAEEVLRNTINIPPTLYKNQGERVGVYVARDLDFSTVYGLKADK